MHAQNQGDTEHAFIPDQPNFELGAALRRGDERDEAGRRKEDVSNALVGLGQCLPGDELDELTAFEQCSPLCGGQGGQEEIFHYRAPVYHEQDIVPSPGYGPGKSFPRLDRITVPSAMTTSYDHSAGSMYVVPFQMLNVPRVFAI
jgi:hypothetical protein